MKWIRLWPDYVINGTTFTELNAEERGVWFSLLALAGYSQKPGTICITEGVAYAREQLSAFLKIPLGVLNRAIERLVSREIQKLVINPDATLSVVNWLKYQTEYDRQKGYRRGLQGKVTNKGYGEKLPTETDIETDKKEINKKSINASALSRKPNYSPGFEIAWGKFPRRQYDNPKKPAYQAWNARLREGHNMDEMLQGVQRHCAWCETTEKIGTEFVMQAKRFSGLEKPFKQLWGTAIPKKLVSIYER